MKKRILLILAVCLLLGGCSTTLMGNQSEVPYETFPQLDWLSSPALKVPFRNALSLRDQGAYEEAYRIFLYLMDIYPEASKEIDEFVMLENVLVRTDKYINGDLFETEKAQYNSDGTLFILSEVRTHEKSLNYREVPNSPYMCADIWEYDAHVEQTSSLAPYTLEFFYGWNREVLKLIRVPVLSQNFDNMSVPGYEKNYIYDSQGRVIRETGLDQRYTHYTIDWDESDKEEIHYTILELPFEADYTYDDSGNILRYDRTYTTVTDGKSWDTYTYDQAGNLLIHESRKEGDVFFDPVIRYESIVREYTYDQDGKKILFTTKTLRGESADTVQEEWSRIEYFYENGQLAGERQTASHTDDVVEIVYTYGDYLIYGNNMKQEEVNDDGSAATEAGESE